MALPEISAPTHKTTLPTLNKEISFRPFLVKEEKNLLMASESEDVKQIIEEVKNLLKNCILSEDISVDSLPYPDLEWMFLSIRAKSKGEIAEFRYKCQNTVNDEEGNERTCGEVNDVEVDLREMRVEYPNSDIDNIVYITDDIGVELKYPTAEIIFSLAQNEQQQDDIKVLASSINKVFEDDEVYVDFTEEDAENFIGQMIESQLKKILDFLNTMPQVKLGFEFTCNGCGKHQKIEMDGIQDFFG